MNNAEPKAAMSRKNDTLKRRIVVSRKRAKEYSQKAGDLKKEVASLRRRVNELEYGLVVEVCPNCEAEVEMRWSVQEDGFRAFCPYCGGRLMLCDECQHQGPNGEYTGDCDYCYGTDSCKHNPRKE